ncbi:MAG: TIGR04282 family arsenosugar biosynthesis glycosyltransferase, partial [Thermodesulfobacteriota bacterium]
MIRVPVPGEVKTRLTPPLTPVEAAGLYRAFLADIFSRITGLRGVDIHSFYTPGNTGGPDRELAEIVPQETSLTPQKGRDLGERMFNVFSGLFERGYERVALIGSDSPDLPLAHIEEAFSALETLPHGLVLGPARDGGYYLIAMDGPSQAPFEGVTWSTETVLEETVKRARENGMQVRLLKEWYDIDTPEDLLLLKGSVEAS